MKTFTKRDCFFVGLTLFSMFFGAGNLIFPPFLGAQAGTAIWIAMFGFAISAICLPILGVITVTQSGGLPELAKRVGPRFAPVFTLLMYLSIGPGLAIPRTASTSFEMAVKPFWHNAPAWTLPAYALVFFTVAMLVAFKPEKLTDRLGKILAPTLLTLILVIVAGCLLHAPGGYAAPSGNYASGMLSQGFMDGYLTMDTIAALNFGILISMNIRNRGVTDNRSVVRHTIQAGWVAGSVLFVVYAALAHLGAVSGGSFPDYSNGAGVLTNFVSWLYGPVGMVLLGIIFVIACLNTSIGLLSACGNYFHSLVPKISYRVWVMIFAGISFCISISGLDAILAISVPILNVLYPVSIVLIALGLAHRFTGRLPLCYPITVAFTGVISVLYALEQVNIKLPVLTDFVNALPLYSSGLCWVVPAVIGCALGMVASVATGMHKQVELS